LSESNPAGPGPAPARIGVVGVPGGWSSERLADALAERTGYRLLVDMARVSVDLGTGRAMFDGTDLCSLDGLIVKKIGARYSPDMLDRLELLRFIEARGVAVRTRPTSILGLLDRLSCTVTLSAAGIPMPPTTVTEDLEAAVATIHGYEAAVLKPLYSTKARGMTVLRSGDPGLRERVAAFKADNNPVMYIQRMLPSLEQDWGVAFLGGEYVATYARVKTTTSWNTTTRDGGRYAAVPDDPEVIAIAQRAQAAFDMGFTTVDVVPTPDGPQVFEVSAFGGFRGLLEGNGIDMASRYADWMIQEVAGG